MNKVQFVLIDRMPGDSSDTQPSEVIVTRAIVNKSAKNHIYDFEVKATISEGGIRINLQDICNVITNHSLRKEIEHLLYKFLHELEY